MTLQQTNLRKKKRISSARNTVKWLNKRHVSEFPMKKSSRKLQRTIQSMPFAKQFYPKEMADIVELLPTGVKCNNMRYKDVSWLLQQLLQQKYRIWNIAKDINQSDDEILLAMLDVFTHDTTY